MMIIIYRMMMMMMFMSSQPETAGLLAGNEISDVVSRCLFHRQLWISSLSMQGRYLEVSVGFEPATFRSQDTEHTTGPLRYTVPPWSRF